ncbi:MAG: MATE family efflux transporter [Ruminococcaceae bacterium]|nr:MATE family efflux transporter [Oscillospiraceae bacterium]
MIFGKSKSRQVLDVTSGPMMKKLLMFAIPVILSGVLQQTFNTADSVIVGRWASAEALGGVSSTASLVNLIICLFNGLSIGAAVAISQCIGAGDEAGAGRYAHNAVATAFFGGIAVGIAGVLLSRPVLTLMGTPEENIEYAVKYMRLYFMGAPFILLYNYGSAILRCMGDTKRPLIYLFMGGVTNVILNVIFVVGFGMDSDGVAIATVASNVISSSLVLYTLCHSHNCCTISLSKVRIRAKEFKRIIALGLPAGIQSAMFSISNVVVQSSLNSFGSSAVAGNGAAISIEAYASYTQEGFCQAALTFSGQNTGAGKYKRIKSVFYLANAMGIVAMLILASILVPLREPIITLFIPNNPEAVAIGCTRMLYIIPLTSLGMIMMGTSACLRGMGKSIVPMLISIFGVCVVRMGWIFTVFKAFRSLETIYLVYPVSWIVTDIALIAMFVIVYKRAMKKSQI